MSLELRFCTIISNDGITIFHRTFVEDDLDEYLFSGFSSAMIAFSRELGDNLSLIKMEKQTIFYHEAEEDGFLIVSFTKGYDLNDVLEKISELNSRDSLNLLLAGSRLGIIQNENEKFERDLFEIFNIQGKLSETTTEVIFPRDTDDYVPPATNLNIPQTKKIRSKTLEEQLEEEAKGLEEFLKEDKKKDPFDKEDKEMKKFLESFDS